MAIIKIQFESWKIYYTQLLLMVSLYRIYNIYTYLTNVQIKPGYSFIISW